MEQALGGEARPQEQGRLAQLSNREFDLAIIGGGIIGAGIARDATLRGLKVALFEKNDFGSGTTSRSTRLIHGGLRYLELFDFSLVRQDLKEREILLKLAPHLVRPLSFLVPMYKRSLFYQVKLRIGMWLYDWLSFDKSLPNHRFLSKQQTLESEPGLKPDNLNGAAVYSDAQVEMPERLCIENILDAQANGAIALNYVKVNRLLKDGSQVKGVAVEDVLTKETTEVRARLVLDASGAWLDPLESNLTGKTSHRVRMTKGIHFTAPTAPRNAIVLFAEKDNRLFFVIPWLGYAWVGTTDTDFEDDLDKVRADADDVEYLRQTVRDIFPKADWETIYFTTAGVRALVRKGDDKDESAVSRKHGLVDHEKVNHIGGFVSVVGGKITAYRGIAEEATDLACEKLGCTAPTETNTRALPGGKIDGKLENFVSQVGSEGEKLGLSVEQIRHLVDLYGSRISQLFAIIKANPALSAAINAEYPDIIAQIHLAVTQEDCLTLNDFMMRRTDLFFSKDQGRAAIETVADELAKLLNWNSEQRDQQIARYQEQLALTQEWKNDAHKQLNATPTSTAPELAAKN